MVDIGYADAFWIYIRCANVGSGKVGLIYSDWLPSLIKVAHKFGISVRFARPGFATASGAIQQINRQMQGGIGACLVQVGFLCRWWPHAVRHSCFLWNAVGFPSRTWLYMWRRGGNYHVIRIHFGSGCAATRV